MLHTSQFALVVKMFLERLASISISNSFMVYKNTFLVLAAPRTHDPIMFNSVTIIIIIIIIIIIGNTALFEP
jgi:small-conductance mechanosensitive channel